MGKVSKVNVTYEQVNRRLMSVKMNIHLRGMPDPTGESRAPKPIEEMYTFGVEEIVGIKERRRPREPGNPIFWSEFITEINLMTYKSPVTIHHCTVNNGVRLQQGVLCLEIMGQHTQGISKFIKENFDPEFDTEKRTNLVLEHNFIRGDGGPGIESDESRQLDLE